MRIGSLVRRSLLALRVAVRQTGTSRSSARWLDLFRGIAHGLRSAFRGPCSTCLSGASRPLPRRGQRAPLAFQTHSRGLLCPFDDISAVSPVTPGLPPPAPSLHEVSHLLEGLLLTAPCSLFSCCCRPWVSTFRAFPTDPAVTVSGPTHLTFRALTIITLRR